MPVDVRVQTGARVRVGSCELEVIGLVGHTPGSIALAYDDPDGIVHLFTGDSLFPGGVGNTFGDADAFVSLINDVESKLFGRFRRRHPRLPGPRERHRGTERPHLASRGRLSSAQPLEPLPTWRSELIGADAGSRVLWRSFEVNRAQIAREWDMYRAERIRT